MLVLERDVKDERDEKAQVSGIEASVLFVPFVLYVPFEPAHDYLPSHAPCRAAMRWAMLGWLPRRISAQRGGFSSDTL